MGGAEEQQCLPTFLLPTSPSCSTTTWESPDPAWLSDRPQVQCVRTYKALQPDELTLEKTDILAVKTRTSDGEGSRCREAATC